jgi:hypothetical protein
MGYSVEMMLLLGSCYLSHVHANCFLGLALQLMYVYDQSLDHHIIKRHVSNAWYWFWTIKALVEAVVL